MFKTNEVSLFEQHVEKGVLALCAIFFLYALFHWGFSSPRRLDGLPPDEVDASLAAKAKTIMSRMAEDRNTDPPSPVDSSAEFKKLQEADNFDKIPPLIAIGPSRAPIKTDRVKGPGRKRVVLQDVASVIPPPGKPEIWSGQELPRTERPADTLAAHVAAVYPWGQLHARWNKALDKTLIITPKMLAVNVEIESRLMWPDGSWGAWKSLEATAYGPTTTEGYRSKPPTIPEPDEQNQQQVADAVQKLQEWQQHILEPEYPDIWWPGHGWVTWRLHLPPNEVGFVPKLDSEELPAGVTPRDRFRPTPIRRSPVSPGRMPGGPGGPGGRMGPGGPGGRMGPGGPGGRMGPGGPGGRMEPGGPGGRMEPGGPVGPGRRPLPDRPDRPISPGTVIPDETAPLPVEQIVPALDQQMVDGQVLAWVHTTSLESGKTYQFRVRLVLLNPLLMEHYSVKKGHEADAGIVTVATPWSDPSDLVYVPKATEFFVTGFSPNTRTVSVSVFRQCLGQTVMRNFTVGLGQSIGKKQQVAVIDPVNNVKVTRAVDFSTGAVAVAFDFDKRVPKGPVHVPTVEALYLDEKGQLRSRVGSVDEGSERYTKLRTDALQAKAAVRQATTGIE